MNITIMVTEVSMENRIKKNYLFGSELDFVTLFLVQVRLKKQNKDGEKIETTIIFAIEDYLRSSDAHFIKIKRR